MNENKVTGGDLYWVDDLLKLGYTLEQIKNKLETVRVAKKYRGRFTNFTN